MTTRDLIYGLIAALAVYLLFLFVRLRALRRRKLRKLHDRDEDGEEFQTIHSEILGGDSTQTFSSVTYDSRSDSLLFSNATPKTAWGVQTDKDEHGDARTQEELSLLRQQVLELKGAQQALLARIDRFEDEIRSLRAACQVSPAYGEAVALAQRGLDALAIAERCGISVAEAELVMSLSERGNGEFGQ